MTRRGYATVAAIGAGVIGITAVIAPAPRLMWNATASVPTGLYALHRQDRYPRSANWWQSSRRSRSPSGLPVAAICRQACR